MKKPLVNDIDKMAAELKANSWTEVRSWTWRAPNGALYRGPAGAWRIMKAIQDNPICPTIDRSLRPNG